MSLYRIYRVDSGGHIRRPATTIECKADELAIDMARQYVDGLAVELWEGARLVQRFEPTTSHGPDTPPTRARWRIWKGWI